MFLIKNYCPKLSLDIVQVRTRVICYMWYEFLEEINVIRSAVGTAVGRYYLALNKGRSYRDFMLANEGRKEQGLGQV